MNTNGIIQISHIIFTIHLLILLPRKEKVQSRQLLQSWINNSRISFTQVTDPANADVTFQWGMTGDLGVAGGTLAVTSCLVYNNTTLSSAVVTFDDAENWTVNGSGIDLETVALHEIGHALGINHSNVQEATMWPYYYSMDRTLDFDDCEAIWELYGHPFSIEGVSTLCGSEIYSVSHLFNGLSVSWSFLNTNSPYGNLIQQNYPVTNSCIINIENHESLNEVLVATISKNDSIITSCSKPIVSYPVFSGTYAQAGTYYHHINFPTIPATNFSNDATIMVNQCCQVTLQSSSFVGRQIYYFGTTLTQWTNNNAGTITLEFPWTSLDGSITIYSPGTSTCDAISFDIIATKQPMVTPSLLSGVHLRITNSENNLNISLLRESTDNTEDMDEINDWCLDIYDSITGQPVYSRRCNQPTECINTTGWKQGIYIVKARESGGNTKDTQRIVIR